MRARLDATDWRILKELQANGRITNVELARKVGISPPPCLRRVRALEQSGMIAEIGEWTLRQACAEAVSWPRPLQIGVNLSPIQFRHGDLAGLVQAVLADMAWRPAVSSLRSRRAC